MCSSAPAWDTAKTVVPTVTRPTATQADHNGVNDPVHVELTMELAVTAERIEGTVCPAARPALSFSGWSELFAVLLTVISEAGDEVTAPDQWTRQA
jgi:hypothetical protein